MAKGGGDVSKILMIMIISVGGLALHPFSFFNNTFLFFGLRLYIRLYIRGYGLCKHENSF